MAFGPGMIASAISLSRKGSLTSVSLKKRLATSLFTRYLIYCTLLSKFFIALSHPSKNRTDEKSVCPNLLLYNSGTYASFSLFFLLQMRFFYKISLFCHSSIKSFRMQVVSCSSQIRDCPLIISLNCSPSLSAALRHMIMRPRKISK